MSIHIKVISLLNKAILYLRRGVWLKGSLYRCKVKGLKSNLLTLDKDFINSKIAFRGKNNILQSSGNVYDCTIRIDGDDNKVIIGKDCIVRCKEIWVRGAGCEIVIGDNTHLMGHSIFVCQGIQNYIHIGKDCLFSTNVQIWNSDTHTILNSEREVINPCKPIVIGDRVWLGQNVSVLKGVTIGDYSVIGLSSVVTKSIPEHSVAVGNPAKRIGDCYDWNIDFVMKTAQEFNSNDEFVKETK